MDKFYSVSDLAQTCGVTERTVRLYVEKELLIPTRVGRSFVFTSSCVERLQTILRDKCIGLSLDEIKSRLDAVTAKDFKQLIARVDTIIVAAKKERATLTKQLSQSGQHRS